MSDQEGYGGPATPDQVAQWNSKSLRGTNVNSVNDEFTVAKAEQTWKYARWHQENHRNNPNPQCSICQLDQVVKQSTKTTPPCKQCGYKLEQHIGPTKECPA